MISYDKLKGIFEQLKNSKTIFSLRIGIIDKNQVFIETNDLFADEAVFYVTIKENYKNRFIMKLKNFDLELKLLNCYKYYSIYTIKNTNNKIVIEYVINSHIQIPDALLKFFKTNNILYYIDNETLNIKYSAHYNTEIGYYPKRFEDYLSVNYETEIGKFITEVIKLKKGLIQSIDINLFHNTIEKIVIMAFFRNPNCVKEVNDKSIFSKLLDKPLTSENIAYAAETINFRFFESFHFLLLLNYSSVGFVTLKSLISNIKIGNSNALIIPIHPDIAILLVEQEKFSELDSQKISRGFFSKIDDVNATKKVNTIIFNYAQKNNEDVIGIKTDLENILNDIK